MCLIIVKKQGDELSNEFSALARRAMVSNSDGVGFGIRRPNGRVIFRRGLYSPEQIINMIYKLGVSKDDDFIFHARACTRGEVSIDNCHPMPLIKFESWGDKENISSDEELSSNPGLLFHNGGFSIKGSSKDIKRSDTYLLARDFVSQYNLLYSDDGRASMREYIGTGYNKVATLDSKHGVQLYGTFTKDVTNNLIFSQSYYARESTYNVTLKNGKPLTENKVSPKQYEIDNHSGELRRVK
jgi:hypothetical protein